MNNSQQSQYNVFTLPNGLRCVSRRREGTASYCGLVVNAGSRDEDADKSGLAHFVEHTIFKGTASRSSARISNRMESIGGELNAYTSKEETVIYANLPQTYTERAFDLLADLVSSASFPAEEVEREREVVIEEIYSYLDSPSDRVYDEYDDMIYAGSKLGRNILGTPESVRTLGSDDCRDFTHRFYVPSNMVFYCDGPLPPSRVERLASKYLGCITPREVIKNRTIPPVVEPFDRTVDLGGHQAHTIVGARTFGRLDPRRFSLFLLNNLLGGPCMNSRLNRELREKRGYVYTVDSTVALLSDCGLMQIYFGSDKEHLGRCRKIIGRELCRLADSPMKPAVLERAKRQYAGQLLMSGDHREAMAMSLGKSLIYFGEIHDVAYNTERILAVTAEEVRATAELLAPQLCSTLTLY